MNEIKILPVFLIMCIFCFSCNVNKQNTGIKESNIVINEAIKDYLNHNDSIASNNNDNNSLTLYFSYKKTSSVNPNNNLSFFVFDKSLNKVIYSGSYSNANITWYSTSQLLLERYFGIIENENSSNVKKYIIDLGSGKIEQITNEIKSNI